VGQHTWNASTAVVCCNWVTLVPSKFQAATTGGALVIQVSISMAGGSNATCAPFIDGVWAGSFEPLPGSGATTPFWREGIIHTGDAWWHEWRTTRVYPKVPAKDPHDFEVRCATDSPWAGLSVNDPSGVFYSYMSVQEIK
jgi:hypothetical protein